MQKREKEKSAKCDRWLAFLNETVQTPAAIMQVQEFIGYCFARDTRFAKCLLLYGPGSSGKSVLIKTIRKLIGPDNCSAVSIADMENPFLRASLYKKLLNISTEEVESVAPASSCFKAVVSGDPIDAAFKHKNSFVFAPYCKLIFSANKLPRVLDNSDGFFRHLLPISFKRQFLENDPDHDPDLESKLEAELPGIFEWGCVGLRRLRKQKEFTQCDETQLTIGKHLVPKKGQVVHVHRHQPPAAAYLTGPHLVISLATLPEPAQLDLKARLAKTAKAENVAVNDLALGLVQVGLQRYAHAAGI